MEFLEIFCSHFIDAEMIMWWLLKRIGFFSSLMSLLATFLQMALRWRMDV